MKKTCAILWLLALAISQSAQNAPQPSMDAIKKLDFLVGEWKGEGWIAFGSGERRTFTQSETIQPKLGGLLLQIEGLGKSNDPGKEGTIIHNAFAIVSYDDKIIGRWDMTVQDASGATYPSWFEATREGEKLAGRFVGRVGSQRPIKSIEYADGHLKFSLPIQFERRKTDLEFEAKLVGLDVRGEVRGVDRLEGTAPDAEGKPMKWSAVRAPKLERKSPPRWSKPTTLFNGHDMSGWHVRDAAKAGTWRVADGVMENTPHGTDIVTDQRFTDFKLHAEFKMVEKSNSGVYLRGRYEVQIEDNFGQEPESHRIGGVYGFITPSSNPAKKAGEWQTYDITLIGRRVTVVFNGITVIDNAEIPGVTGGALDSNEGEPGPVMLQGDHEKIYYRNIIITPAK